LGHGAGKQVDDQDAEDGSAADEKKPKHTGGPRIPTKPTAASLPMRGSWPTLVSLPPTPTARGGRKP
jgi:hypothetical protein